MSSSSSSTSRARLGLVLESVLELEIPDSSSVAQIQKLIQKEFFLCPFLRQSLFLWETFPKADFSRDGLILKTLSSY